MSIETNYLNFTIGFTTAMGGSASASHYGAGSTGTVNMIMLDVMGFPTLIDADCVTTIVDYIFHEDTEIQIGYVRCLNGSSPTGKLYALIAPGVTDQEFCTNFDLRFMPPSYAAVFQPKVPAYIAVNGVPEVGRTMRFIIAGHTAGQQIPYQITMEAEEYIA